MLKIKFDDFYRIKLNDFEEQILNIHDKMEKLKNDSNQYLG